MKRIRNSILIFLVSSFAFISACKRAAVDNATMPSIVSASTDLQVVQNFDAYGYAIGGTTEKGISTATKLEFIADADELGFNFKLSEVASYRITVTGITSKAQFVAQGTGDASTAQANSLVWKGETTNGVLFYDTKVAVKFEVLIDNAYVLKGTDSVFTSAANTSENGTGRGFKSYLLADFETSTFGTPYSDLLELKYFKSNFTFPNAMNPYGGVQGNNCLYWSTFDEDLNTYGGGADMNKGDGDDGSPLVHYGKIKTNNPDSLFINAYICGTGKVGTSLLVIVWEKDDPNLVFPARNGLAPAKFRTDRYGVEYPITWVGWRLVSIPYSAFKKINASYGNGNGVLEPRRFGGVSIGIDSYPIGGKVVEYYGDYFVATEGGPFKP